MTEQWAVIDAVMLLALGTWTIPTLVRISKAVDALHVDQPEPDVVTAVRQQVEAYEAAGFSPEQARELVRESLTAGVRQIGGWQP